MKETQLSSEESEPSENLNQTDLSKSSQELKSNSEENSTLASTGDSPASSSSSISASSVSLTSPTLPGSATPTSPTVPTSTPFLCKSGKCPLLSIAFPAAGELVGTFFLCSLLYILYGAVGNMFYLSAWIQALMTGVVYAAVILMFAQVVRLHLNPAVSLGYALASKISYLEMLIRIIAQCCGAIIAGLILPFLMPKIQGMISGSFYASIANALPDQSVYLKNFAHQQITFSTGSVVALEVLLTMLVVAAALQCASSDTLGVKRSPYTYAATMGVAYTVGSVILFAIDGAGLNPARSLGIAITSLRTTFQFNPFSQLWIFILSPLIAAALVGFTYALFQITTSSSKLSATSTDSSLAAENASVSTNKNETVSNKVESAANEHQATTENREENDNHKETRD